MEELNKPIEEGSTPLEQVSNIKFKNIPLNIELSKLGDMLAVTFESNMYQSYSLNLDDKRYKRFQKELKALFKDFDDIYGEIIDKYNLKTN